MSKRELMFFFEKDNQTLCVPFVLLAQGYKEVTFQQIFNKEAPYPGFALVGTQWYNITDEEEQQGN